MVRRTGIVERVAVVRRRGPHVFGGVFVLLFLLWAIGFANFTMQNAGASSAGPEEGETLGIVVLTGGPNRLQWGMTALTEGRGERLLITGVNEMTPRGDLHDLVEDPHELFACCVDLDRAAGNTTANAEEAARWAETHGFDGLWVVTSYYHMPRALLEFRNRAPTLRLYPLRVEPEGYRTSNWWQPGTFRILAWEYTKYELALMRIRFAILFGG